MLEKALYIKRKEVVPGDEILPGKDYGFSRLSPSHSDRSHYFSLIVEGISPKESRSEIGSSSQDKNLEDSKPNVNANYLSRLKKSWGRAYSELLFMCAQNFLGTPKGSFRNSCWKTLDKAKS